MAPARPSAAAQPEGPCHLASGPTARPRGRHGAWGRCHRGGTWGRWHGRSRAGRQVGGMGRTGLAGCSAPAAAVPLRLSWLPLPPHTLTSTQSWDPPPGPALVLPAHGPGIATGKAGGSAPSPGIGPLRLGSPWAAELDGRRGARWAPPRSTGAAEPCAKPPTPSPAPLPASPRRSQRVPAARPRARGSGGFHHPTCSDRSRGLLLAERSPRGSRRCICWPRLTWLCLGVLGVRLSGSGSQ